MPEELPWSNDAERHVISCAINWSDCLLDCTLTEEQFYAPEHKKIWKAIMQLHKNREEIDCMSIMAILTDKQINPEFLYDLALHSLSEKNFKGGVKIIRECYEYRCIIKACQTTSNLCYDRKPLDSIKTQLLKAVSEDHEEEEEDFAITVQNVLESLGDSGEIIANVGRPSLEKYYQSYIRGQLVVVAARPKVGKTSAMMGLADNLVRQGIKVACYCLEMSKEEMAKRYVSKLSGSSIRSMQNGDQSKHNKIIETACNNMQGISNLIVHDNKYHIQKIINSIIKEKNKNKVDVVFIDYLGLIKSENTNQLKTYQVGDITMALKQLAKELKITIVVLCQLSRANVNERRKPELQDIRDSGSIEQDADVVIFLHRIFNDDESIIDKWNQRMDVIVAAQRAGPTGDVELRYNMPTMTLFDDLK